MRAVLRTESGALLAAMLVSYARNECVPLEMHRLPFHSDLRRDNKGRRKEIGQRFPLLAPTFIRSWQKLKGEMLLSAMKTFSSKTKGKYAV